MILGTVETCGVHPVAQCELARVVDAETALLGRVDEEQPAERPEGLPAEALFPLLVKQEHSTPGVGRLRGGDEARESGPDDDQIRVVVYPHGNNLQILARAESAAVEGTY
jgi:hypothetical protein